MAQRMRTSEQGQSSSLGRAFAIVLTIGLSFTTVACGEAAPAASEEPGATREEAGRKCPVGATSDSESCVPVPKPAVQVATFTFTPPPAKSVPPDNAQRCVDGKPVDSTGKLLYPAKVDVVITVDTSGSMREEVPWVRDNLNRFAKTIKNYNIDYRVVLLAPKGGQNVSVTLCIPPPLGGPGCTDTSRFKHIDVYVGESALQRVIDQYLRYRGFLRKEATTHFIAITDDDERSGIGGAYDLNPQRSVSTFKSAVAALPAPGFSKPYVFHSIVAYGPRPTIGCSTGANIGQSYLTLTKETGGTKYPVCDKNWPNLFKKMAKDMVRKVTMEAQRLCPSK